MQTFDLLLITSKKQDDGLALVHRVNGHRYFDASIQRNRLAIPGVGSIGFRGAVLDNGEKVSCQITRKGRFWTAKLKVDSDTAETVISKIAILRDVDGTVVGTCNDDVATIRLAFETFHSACTVTRRKTEGSRARYTKRKSTKQEREALSRYVWPVEAVVPSRVPRAKSKRVEPELEVEDDLTQQEQTVKVVEPLDENWWR